MIKCSECKYCTAHTNYRNKRYKYMCEHPDKKYIVEYFAKHRIQKLVAFLGFSNDPVMPSIKTSPAWCPYKREDECQK